MDKDEPIEPIEQAEPIDPIEQADPIEPIDRTEPLQPIDRNEPSDHRDKGRRCAMRPRARARPSCTSGVGGRVGSKARDMTFGSRVTGAPSQLFACVGEPPATSYDHNSDETANGPPELPADRSWQGRERRQAT